MFYNINKIAIASAKITGVKISAFIILHRMKTVSQLIREIFATRDSLKKKEAEERNKEPENEPAGESQQSLTLKDEKDETEIDENSGNPGMDTPADQEIDANAEGAQTGGGEGERRIQPGGDGGEPEEAKELQSGIEKEKMTAEALEKAYQDGYLAGKNAKIEEKYFPKTDDGLPNFRGYNKPARPVSTIFSMAREA